MTIRPRRPFVTLAALLPLGLLLLPAPGPATGGDGLPKPQSPILHHGGSIMEEESNVYFIFYGCWEAWQASCDSPGSQRTTSSLLQDFIVGLDGSPYLRINTTYTDRTARRPNGRLRMSEVSHDPYSHGLSLSTADVEHVVSSALAAGALPRDPRGIYLVAASADVAVDGLCTSVAEFHGTVVDEGARIAYAFLVNPYRCPESAAPHLTGPDGSLLPTPNDDFAADAMANAIAHAIAGMLTNVDGRGWFDRAGLENSDKCRGQFGQTYRAPNGAEANIRMLNGLHYLLELNWVNWGKGYCAVAFP